MLRLGNIGTAARFLTLCGLLGVVARAWIVGDPWQPLAWLSLAGFLGTWLVTHHQSNHAKAEADELRSRLAAAETGVRHAQALGALGNGFGINSSPGRY